MSNFFARMGERALGVGNVLLPAVAPLYGETASPRAGPAFTEENTQQIVRASATPQAPERSRFASNVAPDSARHTIEEVSGPRGAPGREPRSGAVFDEVPRHPGAQVAPTPVAKLGEPVAVAKSVALHVSEAAPERSRPLAIEARVRTPAPEEAQQRRSASTPDDVEREDTLPQSTRQRDEQSSPGAELEAMLARLKALSRPVEATAAAPAPTVVRISIGRVEVRAAPAPGLIVTRPSPERSQPQGPSLAQFLAKKPSVSP